MATTTAEGVLGGSAPPASSSLGGGDEGGGAGLALLMSTLSGLATGLGGLLVVLPQCSSSVLSHSSTLGLWQGAAAGFMVSVTLVELAPEILSEKLPVVLALAYALIGAASFYMLKALVPEPDLSGLVSYAATKGSAGEDAANLGKVLWSGLLTALGLALHNFPEGMAVMMAALHGLSFGIPLTIAIAVHNVPEGVAVALPIYFATKSRRAAFLMALASGLAEPAGVLFIMLLGGDHVTSIITPYRMATLLSVVAGIMLSLSLIELLPQSLTHTTSPRETAAAFTSGFLTMTGVLLLLDTVTGNHSGRR